MIITWADAVVAARAIDSDAATAPPFAIARMRSSPGVRAGFGFARNADRFVAPRQALGAGLEAVAGLRRGDQARGVVGQQQPLGDQCRRRLGDFRRVGGAVAIALGE